MIIHPSAKTKLQSMVTRESPWMRIEIKAGGCNGFEKIYTLTDQVDEDDLFFENIVVIDPASHQLIADAQLSYVRDLSGHQFVLSVPQAASNCGCGKSFSI